MPLQFVFKTKFQSGNKGRNIINKSFRNISPVNFIGLVAIFECQSFNVVTTLDLTYNGSVLAREGTAYLLTFEGLVDTSAESPLCFKPLMPELTTAMYVVWRRGQQFTKAADVFLEEMKRVIEG